MKSLCKKPFYSVIGGIMCSDLKTCSELKKATLSGGGKAFVHELFHHLPFGTLAVALSLMILTIIHVSGIGYAVPSFAAHAGCCCQENNGMNVLFHSFHFIHILFAVSGAMMTFYRYSNRIILGMIIGVISSSVFCTLSDVLLPYLAGALLGMDMELHICFFSELSNILPFLLIGALNGLIMYHVRDFKTESNSLNLHFFHTMISALASSFYAVGHGFSDFYSYLGLFFLLILGAVVLPCTIADVVVPIFCARMVNKK